MQQVIDLKLNQGHNATNQNLNSECILQGHHETSSCRRQTMLDAQTKSQQLDIPQGLQQAKWSHQHIGFIGLDIML